MKLRRNKTSANNRISAANAKFFLRNVEIGKFMSLLAGQTGVCP
ncbi:hypothetical protein [Anabaena sp. PCC 7108]|nr:hypothetical protein [Anabaena sp. PCC 7108]